MTLGVWLHLQRAEINQRNAALTREIALISVELRDRLRANALALRGIRAFFGTHSDQSPEHWQIYIQQLDLEHHAPWLRTYGFARRIGGTDPVLAAPATADARKRPVLPGTPLPTLNESFAIEHIAPVVQSQKTGIGFDLYSDSKSRRAIALARDNDEAILTGPGSEILGERSQPTLTMMLPVYVPSREMRRVPERRRDIRGVTFATFRMGAFMESLNSVHNSTLGLRIFDDLSFNNERGEQGLTLLFDSFGESTGSAGLIEEREIEFGQRKWLLQFQPRDKLPLLRESSLLLGGGLIISFLLCLLTWNLSIRRQQAEGYAEKTNAELLRHRNHLHEMVAEQTADLLHAKDIAERANHTKSEFLANMSHELRTPMHAVLSFAALGEEKAAAGNTAKVGRYFQRIRQSGERLLMLLNNLLDLSKLEAGKMHVELAQHDVLPLIDEAAAELEMLFNQRNLKLLIEPAHCSTEAICDRTRFAQVIHNLLSNAIKFSADGGQISITFERASISTGRRTDDGSLLPTLRITVSDQGVGIPPDELDSIFDKFVQSSKTKNGAGGTGLGLSICREIMNAHRGTIKACNNPEQGASFILQLPIAQSPFIHSAPRDA